MSERRSIMPFILEYSFEEDKMLTTSDASDYLKNSSPNINPFDTSTPLTNQKKVNSCTGLRPEELVNGNFDPVRGISNANVQKSPFLNPIPTKIPMLAKKLSGSPIVPFSNINQEKLQFINQSNLDYMQFDRKNPLKSPLKSPVLRDKQVNAPKTRSKLSPVKRNLKRKDTPPEHISKKPKR